MEKGEDNEATIHSKIGNKGKNQACSAPEKNPAGPLVSTMAACFFTILQPTFPWLCSAPVIYLCDEFTVTKVPEGSGSNIYQHFQLKREPGSQQRTCKEPVGARDKDENTADPSRVTGGF